MWFLSKSICIFQTAENISDTGIDTASFASNTSDSSAPSDTSITTSKPVWRAAADLLEMNAQVTNTTTTTSFTVFQMIRQ